MSPADPRTGAAAPAKRKYDSSRRKRQAEQTRAEVLMSAMELFNTRGWSGTTLADVAAAAGVAVETIYSGFGSKKALVRDAFDAAVVGDAERVPYVEREGYRLLGVGTLAARMRAAMDLIADTHERSAGVWRALADAADGDADLMAWVLDAERRRRLDLGRSLERVFERAMEGPLVDILWVLFGPESYRKLVHEAGLTRAQYQRGLAEATLRILGEDPLVHLAGLPG
jgi:AcrR family transcriptional regulator